MQWLLKLLFIPVLLCCIGCTSMHKDINLIADEYVINIEAAKEIAVKLAWVSEFKTCFIRTCLGSDIDELSYKMIVTLDKIDLLIEEIGTGDMTDCQKGQILGLWTRLVSLGLLETVEAINPGALAGLL